MGITVDLVPSPFEDADQLRTAFQKWGSHTNEDVIVAILPHRTVEQRRLIREAYYKTYGEDLFKNLEKVYSSNFERTIILWTLEPGERDAMMANEATKGETKNNEILMEIACTRNSAELLEARQAYHARYKKSLEEDVAQHTTGDVRKLLVALVSSYRYGGGELDITLARQEVKLILEKFNDKEYNHEEVIRILSTRSKRQIGFTLLLFKEQGGMDILKSPEKGDDDDKFLSLLRSTIQCLIEPEVYFADLIHSAIYQTGPDEAALSRIVTTRAEFDLNIIEVEYQKRNGIPLKKDIIDNTDGYYGKMLVSLLGEDTSEGIYTPT